jgi:hypothetical protein
MSIARRIANIVGPLGNEGWREALRALHDLRPVGFWPHPVVVSGRPILNGGHNRACTRTVAAREHKRGNRETARTVERRRSRNGSPASGSLGRHSSPPFGNRRSSVRGGAAGKLFGASRDPHSSCERRQDLTVLFSGLQQVGLSLAPVPAAAPSGPRPATRRGRAIRSHPTFQILERTSSESAAGARWRSPRGPPPYGRRRSAEGGA